MEHYADCIPALEAGLERVNEYLELIKDNDVSVLNPEIKDSLHFLKAWGSGTKAAHNIASKIVSHFKTVTLLHNISQCIVSGTS